MSDSDDIRAIKEDTAEIRKTLGRIDSKVDSDIDGIKQDVSEIKESLDRIEKRQSEDSKSTLQQFLISLGFACMAIGIASLAFEYKVAGSCILGVGIAMVLGAAWGKRFRKN